MDVLSVIFGGFGAFRLAADVFPSDCFGESPFAIRTRFGGDERPES